MTTFDHSELLCSRVFLNITGIEKASSKRCWKGGPRRVSLLFSKALYIVQFSSVAQLCPTLCDPMNRSTPDLPVHHQLPEFTQTHVYRVSDAIQPSHPLGSPSPPPIPPSIRVSSSESTLRMRWPKYWSFSFSIIPSKEIPGLISLRVDWLDLLEMLIIDKRKTRLADRTAPGPSPITYILREHLQEGSSLPLKYLWMR